MKYSLNLFILILVIGCQNSSQKTDIQNNKYDGSLIAENAIAKGNNNETIEGAIGIIVTNENYQFGDTIHVFDGDQKLLKEIIITDENQELSLRCLSKDESFYKVKLENNELGFIPRDERGVKFQTWEEHILSLFAVGFEENLNPLRAKPSENSDKIYYDQDEFYHPNQINGEWLQVKWGAEGSWEYGWVKWKENEKLLIELFYFA